MKSVNPSHFSGLSDTGASDARSMEEILADIRRTAAIDPPTLGELKGAAVPRDGTSGSEIASAHGMAVAPDEATPADPLDLPAILKGRRAGVARQVQSLNRQGLTDALRNAGMLRNTAPAAAEREVARSQQADTEDHMPDEPAPPAPLRSIATIAAVAPPRRRLPEEMTASGEPVHAIVGHAVALATALEVDLNRRRMRIAACGGVDVGPESVPDPRTAAQDAAAELLRPMLRQWLAENMPRIVESALHMEIAAAPGIAKNG